VSDKTIQHLLCVDLQLASPTVGISIKLNEDEFRASERLQFRRSMGSCEGGVGVTRSFSRLQQLVKLEQRCTGAGLLAQAGRV